MHYPPETTAPPILEDRSARHRPVQAAVTHPVEPRHPMVVSGRGLAGQLGSCSGTGSARVGACSAGFLSAVASSVPVRSMGISRATATARANSTRRWCRRISPSRRPWRSPAAARPGGWRDRRRRERRTATPWHRPGRRGSHNAGPATLPRGHTGALRHEPRAFVLFHRTLSAKHHGMLTPGTGQLQRPCLFRNSLRGASPPPARPKGTSGPGGLSHEPRRESVRMPANSSVDVGRAPPPRVHVPARLSTRSWTFSRTC